MASPAYPPQEPLSGVGQAYHDKVMALGAHVAVGEDIPYGDDPYQRILIHRAARADSPVLAFIHGGGWTNGYKEWMRFMAPAVTDAGITFVSIGYRLAPAHIFPTGLDDCADALSLIRERISEAPLFVGGHSAGGHYASLLAVQDDWWRSRGFTGNPIRGCLPISGAYRFGEGSGLKIRPRFLGSENTERAASPIAAIADRTPFLIAHGDRDFPHLIQQAEEMVAALETRGIPAERIVLPDCGHFEASYHAGEAEGLWLRHARAFIERHQ